jgi:hypothetical protein
MDPRAFLKIYVVPAVEAWKSSPLNVGFAARAINELDCLAEHAILARDPSLERTGPDRDALGERNWAVRVCRDVHDTHKHGKLRRENARIKSGHSIRRRMIARPFNTFAFNTMPFGGLTAWALFVQDDDGTTYEVPKVVEECMRFWRAELGMEDVSREAQQLSALAGK